jgi:hypothetical protein
MPRIAPFQLGTLLVTNLFDRTDKVKVPVVINSWLPKAPHEYGSRTVAANLF